MVKFNLLTMGRTDLGRWIRQSGFEFNILLYGRLGSFSSIFLDKTKRILSFKYLFQLQNFILFSIFLEFLRENNRDEHK